MHVMITTMRFEVYILRYDEVQVSYRWLNDGRNGQTEGRFLIKGNIILIINGCTKNDNPSTVSDRCTKIHVYKLIGQLRFVELMSDFGNRGGTLFFYFRVNSIDSVPCQSGRQNLLYKFKIVYIGLFLFTIPGSFSLFPVSKITISGVPILFR